MPQKTIYRTEYEQLLSFLKRVREDRGLSQSELGLRLGQDQTYVSKYEKGVRRLDLIETIDICKVLDINTNEIFDSLRKNNEL